MRSGRARAAIVVAVLALVIPGIGLANHFNGLAGDGTFDPMFTASSTSPIENDVTTLGLTVTQKDHDDAVRVLYLRSPSGFQIRTPDVRAAQYANGSQDDFDCGDLGAAANTATGPLSLADGTGLRSVERAEIIGKMTLVATSDATQPRSTPITWTGDLALLSWNPPAPLGLTLTTGTDGAGDTYIDASWTADPAATSYNVRIKQTGESYTAATTTATTHHFGGLIAGNEYNVGVRVAGGSYLTDATITAGTGTVRPTGQLCALITTTDSRIKQLFDTGVADLRQLAFPFPFRRLADGRWEIWGDISSLARDSDLQTAQASALSLSLNLFGTTKGNWQLDPADSTKTAPLSGFVRNPAVTFSAAPWKSLQTFEGLFHPCHPHMGGSATPCGTGQFNGQSDKPDLTKTSVVTIYPGHAKPVVTAPATSAILLGANNVTVKWQPHPYSDPASDVTKGLSGWVVAVMPFADRNNVAECPASAIYCRGSANPILVNENGNGVVSDADGRTELTVSIPQDGWYSFRISTLYADGHTSYNTDLSWVRGSTSGQFYAGTSSWPLVYVDTRTRNTLKNNSDPWLLFVDPGQQKFALVTFQRTITATVPTMAWVPGETPPDATGAFTHAVYTGMVKNSWSVTMAFTPDGAKGVWLYDGTTGGGNFDGVRAR